MPFSLAKEYRASQCPPVHMALDHSSGESAVELCRTFHWSICESHCDECDWKALRIIALGLPAVALRGAARRIGADHLQFATAGRDRGRILPPGARAALCPPPLRCPAMRWCARIATCSWHPGARALRFTDVAGLIDPTTVTFSVPANPGVRVLEQNFQFDLVSTPKLLLRYLDRPITVERNVGNETSTVTGTLLSAADGLVLRGSDGSVYALNGYSAVKFPGVARRPDHAAHAGVGARFAGRRHPARARHLPDRRHHLVGRLQRGLQRRPHVPIAGQLDLSAWVSIINQSGTTYKDARLKLVAGDVNRVQPPPRRLNYAPVARMAARRGQARLCRESRSMNFICIRWAAPRRCPTTPPSNLSCSEQARQIPARRLLIYDALGRAGLWLALYRARPGIRREYQGRHLRGVSQRRGLRPRGAAAGRPSAGRASGQRRRQPGIHRRRRYRSHPQGRARSD